MRRLVLCTCLTLASIPMCTRMAWTQTVPGAPKEEPSLDEVLQGAPQAVQSPHHDRVARAHLIEEPVELWAAIQGS